jgi:hypothetical protein
MKKVIPIVLSLFLSPIVPIHAAPAPQPGWLPNEIRESSSKP